jgi:hypothetical protein
MSTAKKAPEKSAEVMRRSLPAWLDTRRRHAYAGQKVSADGPRRHRRMTRSGIFPLTICAYMLMCQREGKKRMGRRKRDHDRLPPIADCLPAAAPGKEGQWRI